MVLCPTCLQAYPRLRRSVCFILSSACLQAYPDCCLLHAQATPEAWDSRLHTSQDIDLELVPMRYAAFAEGLARVAIALKAPEAKEPAALHGAVASFLKEAFLQQ